MTWYYIVQQEGLGDDKPSIYKFECNNKVLACRHVEDRDWPLSGDLLLKVEWSPKPVASPETIAKLCAKKKEDGVLAIH